MNSEGAPKLSSTSGDANTLDSIFAINVRRHPRSPALLDPLDRETVMPGAPMRLTYADADRAVTRIADRLMQLGLPRGSVIGVQLPNTVEAILTVLAAMRTGIVVALLPLLWRRKEAAAALELAGAKALIAGGWSEDAELAQLALEVAADTFNIRYVCAFGEQVPDGVIALGSLSASGGEAFDTTSLDMTKPDASPRTGDIAIITFDVTANGLLPVPHTHSELLAGGLSVVLEAGLQPNARLLTTMMTSSFTVFCTAVVPWLLCGGELALHQPLNAEALLSQLREAPCDALVVPGLLAIRLATSGLFSYAGAPRHVLAVWRAPERHATSEKWTEPPPLTDVLAFGEYGHVALRRRSDGCPRPIRAGVITAPTDAPQGIAVLTTARGATGSLALSGPMSPKCLSGDMRIDIGSEETGVDTGYACLLDGETRSVTLSGRPSGTISIGGYRFAIGELQDMIGEVQPGGILAVLPDLLTGEKIAGFAADPSAMRRELARMGVSPLVIEAFRGGERVRQAPAA